jgi:hypothetical protein
MAHFVLKRHAHNARHRRAPLCGHDLETFQKILGDQEFEPFILSHHFAAAITLRKSSGTQASLYRKPMLLQQSEIGKKKQQPLRILLYVPLPVS